MHKIFCSPDMMLSSFTGDCCYCFRDLKTELFVCGCGLSICQEHRAEHCAKFGCRALASAVMDEQGEIRVSILCEEAASLYRAHIKGSASCVPTTGVLAGAPLSPEEELAARIKAILVRERQAGIAGAECAHVGDYEMVARTLVDPRCAVCGLAENLWVCLGCGYIGCGREQVDREGKGHALKHFESSASERQGTCTTCKTDACMKGDELCACEGCAQSNMTRQYASLTCSETSSVAEEHCPLVAYVSSIGSGSFPQVYCYKCDDFIQNAPDIKIAYKNGNPVPFVAEEVQNSEADEDERVTDALLGMKNEGQTCYVATALQLLGDILRTHDLTLHFSLCTENPLSCICCQFVKIVEELRKARQGSSRPDLTYLRIGPFLKVLSREMPEFSRGTQQDSAEFLQALLHRLSFYEEAMLLPAFSRAFQFSTETETRCDACAHSNTSTSADRLLYANHRSSLQAAVSGYFEPYQADCPCGGKRTIQTRILELPKVLIVCIKRYEYGDGKARKIIDPINADKVEFRGLQTRSYTVNSAIIHNGPSLDCGHYTWWVKLSQGCFMVSDRAVKACACEDLKDAVVFKLE